MKKRTLRIGVIGVSNRGRLADLWNDSELDCQVVAGADINEKYLAQFGEFYQKQHQRQVVTTTDYRALLARKDIDAVVIFSPDY